MTDWARIAEWTAAIFVLVLFFAVLAFVARACIGHTHGSPPVSSAEGAPSDALDKGSLFIPLGPEDAQP